jgi:hypothetical protein
MSNLETRIEDIHNRYKSISEQWKQYQIDKQVCFKELEIVAAQNGWEVSMDDVELSKAHNLLTPPDFFHLLGVGDLSHYDECWILPKEVLVQVPLSSNVNSIFFFLTTKALAFRKTHLHPHPVTRGFYRVHEPERYTFKGRTYKNRGLIVSYNTRSKVLQMANEAKIRHKFPNHIDKVIATLNELTKNTLISNYNSMVDEDSLTRDIFTSTYKYLKKLGAVE